MRIGALLLAALVALAPASVGARSQRSSSSSAAQQGTHHRGHHHRIKRDPAQRRAFMHQNPCPATGRTSGACPGYVVDHITPLKRGGADRPWNMQWQTKAEAKAKDRRE
jgi:5-methylcytosine-specific restriction endonuclease McrA